MKRSSDLKKTARKSQRPQPEQKLGTSNDKTTRPALAADGAKVASVAGSLSAEEIISDYRIAYQSRQVSLIGRKEVMGGKAKFGIFGDGKEVPQLAMARAFRA